VVLGEPAHVRLGAPVRLPVELPVGPPVRIGARVDPVALLEAYHADAGPREPPGDGSAGGAGADHEDVRAGVGGPGRHPARLYYDLKEPAGSSPPGGFSIRSRIAGATAARLLGVHGHRKILATTSHRLRWLIGMTMRALLIVTEDG